MQRFVRFMLAMTTVLFLAQSAALASTSYVVLPFNVNGPSGFSYLEKAITSMLTSRFYVQDVLMPATENALTTPPASQAAVEEVLGKTSADVAIWGEVNIIGDNATIDMRALKNDGTMWNKNFQATTQDMVNVLQRAADTVNVEVFGRNIAGASNTNTRIVPQLNSAIVHNEITPHQTYLNPQFRYQGADGDRLRSQALPYASRGMALADVTGDGKTNVVLLDDYVVRVYTFEGQLQLVSEYELPRNMYTLSVRTINLNGDSADEVVVSAYDPDYTEPVSYILSFMGGQAREMAVRQRYYLNVVRLSPDFRATLIGQKGDSQRIFSRNGVYELMLQGGELTQTRKIQLPSGANVFNFAWLPAGGNNTEDLLLTINKNEQLQAYSTKGNSVYQSEDAYSGSAVGITEQTNMPGLGKESELIPSSYWIPLRMIAADFDDNYQWELLVNKPISISSQIFDRYRSFPEGEINAMFWDGVGMNLLWKTRRIKGTVVDFDLGDFNNDGIPDLVVNVNTHPGALGLGRTRTMIVAYPLDLSSADPNTAPVQSLQ